MAAAKLAQRPVLRKVARRQHPKRMSSSSFPAIFRDEKVPVPYACDQHLHHHPRIVGRVAPPVPFVRRVERPEIQGVHQVAHMVRQVPFRNPLPKILRQ